MQKSNINIWRVALGLVLALLVVNVGLTILVVGILEYPVTEDRDSFEYYNLTTNLLEGHGFAVEPTDPWRPNASRSPGFLITTIPLKLLFGDNPLLAAIGARVWVIMGAVLIMLLGHYMGLGVFAWFAAAFMLASPTVLYYLISPYISEMAFIVATAGLYIGFATLMIYGRRWSLLLIAVAVGLALAARASAQVSLVALVIASLIASFWLSDSVLRRRALLAAAAVVVGALIVYVGWSLRNFNTFGVFDYTTISSYNILHYDAAAMIPFLDVAGQQEVNEVLEPLKQRFQTYYGTDQFEIAHQQRAEGIRLILKYPLAFVASHIQGALETFFIFRVRRVEEQFGMPPIYLVSVYQAALTAVGGFGLYRLARKSNTAVQVALMLMLVYAVSNILIASGVKSPRFRMSLDMLLAVGVAVCIQEVVSVLMARTVFSRRLS